jgi:hypothetical protein
MSTVFAFAETAPSGGVMQGLGNAFAEGGLFGEKRRRRGCRTKACRRRRGMREPELGESVEAFAERCFTNPRTGIRMKRKANGRGFARC